MSDSVAQWLSGLQAECFSLPLPDYVKQTDSELQQIRGKILATLNPVDNRIASDIPVALVSHVAANAHVFRLPRRGYGICVDYAFVAALRVLNELVVYEGTLVVDSEKASSAIASIANAFSTMEKRSLRNQLRTIVQAIDNAKVGAATTHDPELLKLAELAAGAATGFQFLWIIAHEFAHILCNHLSDNRTTRGALSALDRGAYALEFYKIIRNDEQEADERAAAIFSAAFKPELVHHGAHFVDIVFQFLNLIEDLWRREGVELVETHPAAEKRQSTFFDILSSKADGDVQAGGYAKLFKKARHLLSLE